MLKDLVLRNRSYRRFDARTRLTEDTLRGLVELARCSASGGNLQSLRYLLSTTNEGNGRIFGHLAWAGYLQNWPGPAASERPTAYIVILHDRNVSKTPGCDHGIAAQTMLLAATEAGLGGCMIGAIDRGGLATSLNLPDHYEICLVVALGKPAETVVLEDVDAQGSIRYYRDEQDTHHVPKRRLDDLVVEVI